MESPAGRVPARDYTKDAIERLAADPRMAALLVQLAQVAATNNAGHDKGLSENGIAGSGSSLTEEEPMYRWVSTKPYAHHHAWRVFYKTLDGEKKYETFTDEEAAWEFIRKASKKRLAGGGHAVEEVLAKFLEQRRPEMRPSSVRTLEFRVDALIQGRRAMPVEAFPWQRAWDQHIATQSVDSQLGVRSALRGLFKFCLRAGLLRREPLSDLEVRGRKHRGKEQLRIDEARRFVAEALRMADDPMSLACATMVLTGVRPGEAMNLRVRDVDDGGALLWVDGTKTESSRRRVEIVEQLRPLLLAHARDRKPEDFLFMFNAKRRRKPGEEGKRRTDALLRHMGHLCAAANVPRVVSHSLRGLHSTLATAAGATGHAVAQQLGHSTFEVTKRHYLAPGVLAETQLKTSVSVLVRSETPSVTALPETVTGTPKAA